MLPCLDSLTVLSDQGDDYHGDNDGCFTGDVRWADGVIGVPLGHPSAHHHVTTAHKPHTPSSSHPHHPSFPQPHEIKERESMHMSYRPEMIERTSSGEYALHCALSILLSLLPVLCFSLSLSLLLHLLYSQQANKEVEAS